MIDQLLAQAQKQVDSIKKKCPKVGAIAQKELDEFKPKLVCSGTPPTQKYKDDTFGGLRDAIELAKKACPEAEKELYTLEALIDTGVGVKCGP